MSFNYPWILILLMIIPVLIWYYLSFKSKKDSFVYFSNVSVFEQIMLKKTESDRILFFLRISVIFFLILSAAGLRQDLVTSEYLTKGVNIIIALDTSGSMQSQDVPPNRFKSAVNVVEKFIEGRKNDKIGLVVFGGVSFLQAPLTLDYNALYEFLANSKIGMTQTENTAIGSAICTAVLHLKDVEGKSKVIILVTDGRNNAGKIDPITAAKLAEKNKIKIYTVAVGVKNNSWPQGSQGNDDSIDEELLTRIASITGGEFFRAQDNSSLKKIFNTINSLEKVDIKEKKFTEYRDKYRIFLIPAMFLFLLEIILSNTIWRKAH